MVHLACSSSLLLLLLLHLSSSPHAPSFLPPFLPSLLTPARFSFLPSFARSHRGQSLVAKQRNLSLSDALKRVGKPVIDEVYARVTPQHVAALLKYDAAPFWFGQANLRAFPLSGLKATVKPSSPLKPAAGMVI